MDDDVTSHAVVLGGGMAGLLAARVLADVYRDVLIIDRDQLAGVTGPRRGVPHGRHAHALLAKGHQILVELFPGIVDELAADGVPVGDLAGNLRWYFLSRRLQPAHSGLLSISSTRPVLEARVRERVRALGNVRWLEEHAIRGLVTTTDRRRVTGVRVVGENGSNNERIVTADLVIDATGRGSRAPVWLTELGYPAPAENRVKVNLAYTTPPSPLGSRSMTR
jgi:2-polyprenyl-6-methoxyphenol hydroxylase-like FAD-dependent oxidoreductase